MMFISDDLAHDHDDESCDSDDSSEAGDGSKSDDETSLPTGAGCCRK